MGSIRIFNNIGTPSVLAAIAALAIVTSFNVLANPAKAQDAMSKAEKKDASRVGILEAKDIAEEGFIYGLPLVMNYAVMQEFAVNKNSGQFKAPFNEIENEHRVSTPADTAVITPNSDTPYSMAWLDLRAEPMVISVPMVEKSRYYALQLIDGNTYNYGYVGSRATGNDPGVSRGRPRLERWDAHGDQEGLPIDDAVHTRAVPYPALQSRRHAQRRESAGWI